MAGGDTPLEAALRRDRWMVVTSLAGVTALAWVYLVVLANAMAAMEEPSGWRAFMGLMPMGPWGPLQYVLGFAMWTLMMVGMMVPSAAPMILLYARVARRTHSDTLVASTTTFAAGYLVTWAGFSLVAAGIQGVLIDMALVTETMTSASTALAGAVFIAAGIYQWMPMKKACLDYCRSPIWFLSRHWRSGTSGALRMGIAHGAYCVGCCWALMAVLFAVGIMNLAWVAAIAVFVLAEKTAPFGIWAQRVSGILLVTLGIMTLAG